MRFNYFSFLIVGLFILFSNYSSAQENPHTFKEIKKRADQKKKLGDLYGSIEWYREAYQKAVDQNLSPGKQYDLVHQLAKLYRKTRNYREASKNYKLLSEKRSGDYPQARFYYGLMLQQQGKYEKALSVLKKVKKHYRGPSSYRVRKKVDIAVKGCEIALKESQKGRKSKIRHLNESINSAYTEFSPLFLDSNKMIYASRKLDSLVTLKRGQNLKSKTRFYKARKHSKSWKHKGPWELIIHNPKHNVGNGSFSPDGKRFYFTKCELNKRRKMVCKIYVSNWHNNSWTEPKKLPEPVNKKGITSTHPTTAAVSRGRSKSEMLIFASERERGRGGMDIWYSVYEEVDNEYSRPRNAGRYVNTKWDEMTPYFDTTLHKLYFSSNGRPGYGGMDIFEVGFRSGRFQDKPENKGRPINSPADDLYFVKNSTNDALVVSNRKGSIALKHPTCCDDIFAIQMPKELIDFVSGKIIARSSDHKMDENSIKNATVRIYEIVDSGKNLKDSLSTLTSASVDSNKQKQLSIKDPGFQKRLVATDTVSDSGYYHFNLEDKAFSRKYVIEVNKKGFYKDQTDTFTRETLTKKGNQRDLSLKPIPREPIIIPNIYYKFDKATLKPGSKGTLDTTVLDLMEKNPKLILEIRSHTDSIGSDEYNQKLSQERAQSVVDYLVEHGIERKRLKAKGYGESRPIAPNTNPDGTDNPEGRRKNRRTEFKVIGELKGNKKIIYEE